MTLGTRRKMSTCFLSPPPLAVPPMSIALLPAGSIRWPTAHARALPPTRGFFFPPLLGETSFSLLIPVDCSTEHQISLGCSIYSQFPRLLPQGPGVLNMRTAMQCLEVSRRHVGLKMGVLATPLSCIYYVLNFHCTVSLRFHNQLRKQLLLLSAFLQLRKWRLREVRKLD